MGLARVLGLVVRGIRLGQAVGRSWAGIVALAVDTVVVIKGAWCCARGVGVQQRTADLVFLRVAVVWRLSIGLPLKSVRWRLSRQGERNYIQRREGLRILLVLGTP